MITRMVLKVKTDLGGFALANEAIKQAAREGGVKLWQLAERWGCTDGNFSRKLRRPFTPVDERRALAMIKALRKEVEIGAEDAHDCAGSAVCQSR